MCSYNRINDVWLLNDITQNQILRDEWGFEGFNMSDWGATHRSSDLTNPTAHAQRRTGNGWAATKGGDRFWPPFGLYRR
jgi:beta-glucosidase